MKKPFFILSFSFLFVIIGVTQPASLDSVKLQWEKFTLPNGLQVVFQPDPTQTEVSVEFWVHMGARNEAPGRNGFAHFFEHATPYGLGSDTAALNRFRANRTNSNAQTRNDYTRYYVQVKPEALDIALRYAADRMRADTALIQDSTIEKHRKNVLAEMKRQEASPMYSPSATSARAPATFGEHPYGHSGYGSIKENESFTTAEVKLWYAQYFFPQNIVLFIVGNFDVAKTKLAIQKEFGSIAGSGTIKKFDNTIPTPSSARTTLSTQSGSHFLSITWPLPSYGSKDDPVLKLLSYIVEERLAKSKPDFITKTSAIDLFALYQLAGQFGVSASFNSIADSNKVENYLYETVQTVINKGVTKEELDNAKLRAIDNVHGLFRNLGFIESRTELLGEGLFFANDPGYYYKRLQKQSKLNEKDIKAASSKWLNSKGGRVLLISDFL